jgi:DNA-binding Lrp family transcriptional regulator
MITAIVQIKTEPGQVADIAFRLSELQGVSETYSVTGDWDIVLIVKVNDFEDLALVVSDKIAKLPGILRTNTSIGLRCFPRSVLEQGFSVGMEETKKRGNL